MSDRGWKYDLRRQCQVIAFDILGSSIMSKIYFRIVLKRKLHLKNPKTFNEKIQWYKLFFCPKNSDVILCSDKLKIREYLKRKGLLQYQVPLIGYWEKVSDINWEKLPQRFAIKCNHGCAYNIICSDKSHFDTRLAEKRLSRWLREDFGKFNAEVHYSKISPYVLCEEFLDDSPLPLIDYKVHCFNGVPEFILICSDRDANHTNYNYYDLKWQKLPYSNTETREFPKPDSLDEMIQVSKKIAKDFPFVRVDFYYVKGKIMIGELTFVPAGGLDNTLPYEADMALGEMFNLNI